MLQNARYCYSGYFAQYFTGEQRRAFLRFNCFQPCKNKYQRQYATNALAYESCPCNAGYAHLKRRNEQYVRTNVAERRCRKEVERRFGIAKRGEYARCNIIEEHKRKSENVYAEIQRRISHYLGRSIDKQQHLFIKRQPCHHKHSAQHSAGNKRGRNSRFHVLHALCAEELRYDHRSANITAERKRDEYKRYFIAVANGCKRIFAYELARNKAVCNIIKLLEYYAAKQRQAKPPQYLFALSDGKIVIHNFIPPHSIIHMQQFLHNSRAHIIFPLLIFIKVSCNK